MQPREPARRLRRQYAPPALAVKADGINSPAVSALRETALGLLLAALVVGGNAAYVAAHLGPVHRPTKVLETDHFRYIEMARGEKGREIARDPPYCWRVLVPGLARLLNRAGVGLNVAFYALTNAVLVGWLTCLFLLARDVGLDRGLAAFGLLLAGLMQGAVRWFEYQYWMTDPAGLFLTALAFLFVRRGRDWPLRILAVIFAFVRENHVLLYPYYLLRLVRQGRPLAEVAWRTAALAAVPIAVTFGLRRMIEANQPDDMVASLVENVAFRFRHLEDNQPYVLTVGTWGVLFPLLLLYPRRLAAWARTRYDALAFVLSVYATLLVSNNTERPLAYALPVVLPAALRNLQTLEADLRLPRLALFALVLAPQVLLYSETLFFQMPGSSLYQPANGKVAAAMAGLLAVLAGLRRWRA